MADLKSKQIKFPLTGTNVVSSSAQISTDISGSFVADSGSFSTRITTDSGSFSTRVTTTESELGNTLISSSAQISTDISGSFTQPSASISTRLTTNETGITNLQTNSGSFSTRITTAESELGNTLISSSAQISTDISGSLSAAAIVGLGANIVSGSIDGTLSGSQQIASDISGSFTGELSGSGIKFVGGGVSGSAASTGSLGHLLIDGDVKVSQFIYHSGDPNTYLNFTGDRLRFNIGGISYIDLNDSTSAPHDITFNDGANNVDFTIKGSSNNPLFKTDASSNRIGMFGVGTPTADLHIDGDVFVSGSNGHITASGDISSSANITANNFSGIFNGALSSSAQISSDISGSFTAPSASFSTRVTTAETELENTLVSSSAQLSTDISGSFTAPSASFSTRVTTAETELENTLLSGSAQIATDISGSFVAPSGSFSTRITNAESELGNTLLSGSAQIATDISGSLSTAAVVGLGAGIISGSSSNSSLTTAIVTEGAGILSGSAQIAGDVSGSFTSGFEFTGNISGSSTSTGSFGSIETDGDINVSGKLAHAGDPDTRILFADDDINITVGNVNMVDFTQDTISEVTFNEAGADVDFRIETANDSKALYINAGDDTIQLGSSANTHITASGNISGSAGNILGFKSGSFQQLDAGVVQATNLVGLVGTATQGTIDIHSLSGYVANENIDHSSVSITAGAGLTGGGTIASTRDIAVGAGTGVTVNANDVAIGQAVATDSDVEFASVTATGNITAQGDVIAQNYIVSSSVTFMTSSIRSGSTVSGDTPADDTHQFTGSLFVTGSTFNIDENGGVSSSASGSFLNVDIADNLGVTGKFTLPNITDVSASIASAVAGGDDMGNHTATQDLDMDGNDIVDVGHITSSGNISGSAGDILGFVSASFSNIDAPHIKATNVHGTILTATQATIDHDSLANFVANEHIDHSGVTLTAGDGLSGGGTIASSRSFAVDATVLRTTGDSVISSSAQLSTDISGSFVAPSGSFSTRITTAESELGNTLVSSSAQLSTDISGSFVAPSGSFSTRITTAESELSNTLVSSSAQLSTDISGSFVAPSGSFSTRITNAESELGNTLISSSAQLADDISGSFSTAAVVGLGAGIISGSSSNSSLTTAIVSEGAGILSGSAQISADISGSLSTAAVVGLGANLVSASAQIDHDSATNFVANEHIDHSSVSVVAGDGLTGGGTIAANRTINVAGGTGVTANANDIAIGQDVATSANVLFAAVSASGNISGSESGSFLNVNVTDNLHVSNDIKLIDNGNVLFGADNDMNITHNGTDSFIDNYKGHLNIRTHDTNKDIVFSSGSTAYLTIDSSAGFTTVQKLMRFGDDVHARFGTGSDLKIFHDGTDSKIDNYTGTLKIRNFLDDADITLESDDGSGGVTPYITLDGSEARTYLHQNTRVVDSKELTVGDGDDLAFSHNGTNSFAINSTGDLTIQQNANDKDIILSSDDGSGGTTAYITLDGSAGTVEIAKPLNVSANISGSQIEASGDVIAFGSSDRNLKDNITPIENPLEKMEKIGGYTFDWNDKQDTYKGHDIGVVAQEIQSVLPEIVASRANGYLGVKYEKIVPLLIESIKENTKQIKELKQEINEIKENCDCLNK